MSMQPLYQTRSDLLELEAAVLDARPGMVLLSETIAFPGGGGQLPDRATLRWDGGAAAITAVTAEAGGWWHAFEGEAEVAGPVRLSVDAGFRHLMAELHTTGHSRFPVFEGKKQQDTVVGILYLRDIIGMTKTVPVREAMHAEVSYIHEDFTLYQALQAFIKTKQHLFIVVNAFEEYVGIITIEDVLERVIGKLIVDEFDKYDDLRAVAAAAARKEHAENHKNGVGAEPTPETKEMVQ